MNPDDNAKLHRVINTELKRAMEMCSVSDPVKVKISVEKYRITMLVEKIGSKTPDRLQTTLDEIIKVAETE